MCPNMPIKRSLAIFLFSLAAPVSALSLGELQPQSFLGQRFKGAVNYQLSPSETSLADCITISPAGGDLPYIGSSDVQIRPIGDGNTGTIIISSNQKMSEPVVALNLHIQCGTQQLSREFTVFLDPAPLNELASTSAARPLETFKIRPELKPATAKKDTTLAAVAARYYVVDTPQYQKYLNRLKQANPDIATTDTLITVGSPLVVPPRPKLATAKVASDVPLKETGQLRLEDGEASKKPAVAPINPQQNPEAYVKELEEKIVTLTELKKQLQLELAELDIKMTQIQLANAKSASAAVASYPAPVAQASAAQVAATTPKRVVQTVQAAPPTQIEPVAEPSTNWRWAWWLLGLAGVGGCIVWWRRKMQEQAERWAHEDINDGVDLNRSIMSIIQAKVGHTMAQQSPNTVMSLFGASGKKTQSGFEVKEELENHLDQAQYYLAQGETLKAIDLLYSAIDEVPEDTERWLMLFRVFRQQVMKTEYSALAYRFKAIHKDEGDWELIRSIGNKLDPENPLFIRKMDAANEKTATPFDHFDSGMAAAAPAKPVELEIVPDFSGAPILPELDAAELVPQSEQGAMLQSSDELMTFLVQDSEPDEPPPLLPEVEKHR